jgi:hypothetical protein
MRRAILNLLAAAMLSASAFPAAATDETAESLPNFPGRDDTFGYCIGCHSFKVVGRQGMNRERWDDTLTWMSEKHSMPAPDADMRKVLLDYLEKAYPQQSGGSRGWTNPFAPKR